VAEDSVVEVDPAQSLHSFRPPKKLEARLGLAQDRSIERAAAEVVDGHDLSRLESVVLRVADRRGFGFGQELDRPHVRQPDHLIEEVELVRPEIRRVCDHDQLGFAALPLRDRVDDPAQQPCHERLCAVRRPRQHQRRRVTEAALEFAGSPSWLGQRATLGGFSDEDLAVGPQNDD
jgi:hypothetical protein